MHFPLYTQADWTKDKTFKAHPYSEIDHDIYTHFLECLPPLYVKDTNTLSDYIELDLWTRPESVKRAFQNSEPTSHEKNFSNQYVPFYNTFAYVNDKPLYLWTFPSL